MMKYEYIFRRAEERGESNAFSRLSHESPIELYAGLDQGRRSVMLISLRRSPDPPPIAAICSECRHRSDGRWALVISLCRPELSALFGKLVEDLEEAALADPTDCGGAVVQRLIRWQRLFARGTSELLDDRALRGLAAELDFLLTEAIPTLGLREGVSAWAGPYGAHKDFENTLAEVEVKALHPDQKVVSISSLEQLAPTGSPLYLWTKETEGRFVEPEPSRSFAKLVSELRTVLSADAQASEMFEEGLTAAGYRDRPEYAHFELTFGPSRCYLVRDDFPRLLPPSPADAISSCRYDLAVHHLEAFHTDSWHGVLRDGQ